MPSMQPRYSADETARRGDDIYNRTIRPLVEITSDGKVVAIDVETETYVIGDNALEAARGLREFHPNAVIWFVRVGRRALYHIGARQLTGRS